MAGYSGLRGMAVVAAAIVCGQALALTEGKTAQGEPFVTGGIALGERDALEQRRPEFNFWVVTAAKNTGAYLADVRLRIADDAGKMVFDATLDGPWLLVRLKLGRYAVEARRGGETQRKTTTVHTGDRHEMLFYFDVDVDTLPKGAKR